MARYSFQEKLLFSFATVFIGSCVAYTFLGSRQFCQNGIEDSLLRRSMYSSTPIEGMKPAFCLCQGPRRNASITIGVPTVRREQQSYLLDTLDSLISNMSPDEKAHTLIIVFVAETNLTFVIKAVEQIRTRFENEVNSGLLEVISPPRSFYPDMDRVPVFPLGVSKRRFKWRSKQNLDYAFLMNYAKFRSPYYLQIEDDVFTKKGFISEILGEAGREQWLMITFCEKFGFIGKLFKTTDLPYFADLFYMFFDNKPVDLLLMDFINFRICGVGVPCGRANWTNHVFQKPSLFYHVGTFSSLKGKVHNIEDVLINGETPLFLPHDNPPATVDSSVPEFRLSVSIENAYKGKGLFWGEGARPGDHISLTYSPPIRIKRFLIRTGNAVAPAKTLPSSTIVKICLTGATNEIIDIGQFDAFGVARGTVSSSLGSVLWLRLDITSNVTDFIISEILIVTEE